MPDLPQRAEPCMGRAKEGDSPAMKYWRQGDVCIIPIDAMPSGLTPVERDDGAVVLAYGEVTGHKHQIRELDVELFAPGEASVMAERFLRVGETSLLIHEEHATIALPPGEYEVRHQREYSPEDLRQVAD